MRWPVALSLAAACATGALSLASAAPAATLRQDEGVYARVTPTEVVLGNALAERRWTRAPFRTAELVDKRAGGRVWSRGSRDFTLSAEGAQIGSERFTVASADVTEVAGGGLRVTMHLSGAGMSATRVAEAYPGVAGFRVQTTIVPAAAMALTSATLDEAAVGPAAATIHAFRAGADWREPDWKGPDFTIGEGHGGTWHVSQSAPRGAAVEGAAQWVSAADGARSLFSVMERNDFPSSRAFYDGETAGTRVDYSRDGILLGPLEQQAHIENPLPTAGRPRTVSAGAPLALEAAFTGFGSGDGDEPWQFYRYLRDHRLAPYRADVTFNSNGTDSNKISTGAKDDMNLAMVQKIAPIARRLGIETFILDDGWQARSGDWQPDSPQYPEPRYDGNPASKFAPRFPDAQFKAVRDAIAPMKLGLWMSPTFFNPSSETFQVHPEWACQPIATGTLALNQSDPESGSNEAGIVPWGPAAIPHIESRIRDAIDNWGVEYFKFDFLAWFDCAGQGDLYGFHDAFVAMLDRLRRDHPDVTFQIDETNDYRLFPYDVIARGPTWFQNGTPSPERLLHNLWNLSPYVPAYALGQHFLGGKLYDKYPVATLMAAALPSHLTFFSDLRSLPDPVIAEARPWLDFYAREREHFVQMAYPLLADPLKAGWTALQPWDPERGFGALLAFRQDSADDAATIPLRNVPPGRRFDLFEAPDGRYAGTSSSAELTHGVRVTLARKRTARVLVIQPSRPLELRLRQSCRRGRVRAAVGGRDRTMLERVRFYVGHRRAREDRHAPFVRTLPRPASRRARVRARAVVRDGRVVSLTARLRRCTRSRG